MKRYIGLDIIRGVGIVWMVIYHLYFDICTVFGYKTESWIDFVGNIGGISFILISGYAFFLASQKYQQSLSKKYIGYSIQIALYAMIITVLTFLISPDNTVWFGILHFFSLAFLLLLFVYKTPRIFLLVIVFTSLTLGYFLNDIGDSKILFLLGLNSKYSSGDYYPLFPYFGYIIFGYLLGSYHTFLSILKNNFFGKIGEVFAFFGRKSLYIYLIHQPIIYAILLLIKEFTKN